MTKDEITSLIHSLANQTAANSITPMALATILFAMNENIEEKSTSAGGTTAQPTVGDGIYERGGNIEYFFGHTVQRTTTPALESSIVLDDDTYSMMTGRIVSINTNDEDAPMVQAVVPCLVEVTGYLTVKANESYTSDRIFRMFKIDDEGERIDGQTNIVHFTGTTQIFSVPINYMAFMFPGETLHLTTFSSSGTTTISANSYLNIKAVPIKR